MLDLAIKYDIDLMNFIRSFVDPNNFIEVQFLKILSDFGVFLIIFILIGLWFYGVYKKNNKFKIDALLIFYSIAFSFIIYIILNLGLPIRPRPETFSTIVPLINHIPDNSFPSGHAIFVGSSLLGVFLYTKKWIFWFTTIFLITMLVSRILVGVHYPSDIIAGFIIGLLGGYVVYKYKNSKLFTKYLIPTPIKIANYLKL